MGFLQFAAYLQTPSLKNTFGQLLLKKIPDRQIELKIAEPYKQAISFSSCHLYTPLYTSFVYTTKYHSYYIVNMSRTLLKKYIVLTLYPYQSLDTYNHSQNI